MLFVTFFRLAIMKKVTQIDYQIILLEGMGSRISEIESRKLNNLREQKKLMDTHGIKMKPTTVPWFPPCPSKHSGGVLASLEAKGLGGATDDVESIAVESENDVESAAVDSDDVENGPKAKTGLIGKKKKSGQGVSSAYIKFISSKRELLVSEDSSAKLDLPMMRTIWERMKAREKQVYEDMVSSAKIDLGDNYRKDIKSNSLSDTEKKQRKKVADKKYRDGIKKEKSVNRGELENVKVKLKEIISYKEEKLNHVRDHLENLKSEVHKVKELKKETTEKLVDKDLELVVAKEKFKVLHKKHKRCAKDTEAE